MSGFRQPLTITRKSGASYVNGFWAGGSEASITIQASKQPTTGEVRKNLPEGYDIDSAFDVFTDTELYPAQAGGQKSDTATISGDEYHCVALQSWQNGVINHYRATFARPKTQP